MNNNLFVCLSAAVLFPLACSSGTPSQNTADPRDAAAGGDDGAGAATVDSPPPPSGSGGATVAAIAPGLYVVDPGARGSNACAGKTLNDVLVAIRAANPALGVVKNIYNPGVPGSGDGNFIYPYQVSDGGFAIAFKRGMGDCPAGCTDNTYDYFQTDETCAPKSVGHYHAVSGACLQVEGTPLWGHPTPPPDPSMVCGADNQPKKIAGTYLLRLQGKWQPCAVASDKVTANPVDTVVTVTVAQNDRDLATGSVIIKGTNSPIIDGVTLPARFMRQRFEAMLQKSNLPSNCPQESSVTALFDFENVLPGTLTMMQLGDSNCSGCKGSLSASLTLASVAAANR